MRANLEMRRGLIFSGQLLLDLAAKGVLREEAYQWVQRNAMRAWENGEDFRKLVEADPGHHPRSYTHRTRRCV